MTKLSIVAALCCVVISGCSETARARISALSQASAGGAGGATEYPTPPAPRAKLMLFGGVGHKTYLGCLNCSDYAIDSVKNEYGPHGSRYASESIFNQYGSFGSPYSSTSACSEYASDPPVIVDENGGFYGRLTLNRYHPQIGMGASLMGWLKAICEGQ